MIEIPLSQGQVAFIDDIDLPLISEYAWSATRSRSTWYARTNAKVNGKWTTPRMHRLILNADIGAMVDHRDGNGLNNQRSNLRFCTDTENCMNRKVHRTNASGFKGVHLYRKNGQFGAMIRVKGTLIYLGSFSDPQKAAQRYNAAALEYFGDFARLNVID